MRRRQQKAGTCVEKRNLILTCAPRPPAQHRQSFVRWPAASLCNSSIEPVALFYILSIVDYGHRSRTELPCCFFAETCCAIVSKVIRGRRRCTCCEMSNLRFGVCGRRKPRLGLCHDESRVFGFNDLLNESYIIHFQHQTQDPVATTFVSSKDASTLAYQG